MGIVVGPELSRKILELAGEPPARTPPKVLAGTPDPGEPATVTLTVTVWVRLASEANAGGRLPDKIRRKSVVKAAVRAALPVLAEPFPLPATVTITRLGGRQLDELDNLPRSAKAVKDVVAEWLGVADTGRDKRVTWRRVRQAPAYRSGVRITITGEKPRG